MQPNIQDKADTYKQSKESWDLPEYSNFTSFLKWVRTTLYQKFTI